MGLHAAPRWHEYPALVGGMISGVVSGFGLLSVVRAQTPQEKNRGYKILAAGAAVGLITYATNVHYFFLQGCQELAKQAAQNSTPQAICRYIIPYCQC